MIDSNNDNNTEVPADLLEEQASQSIVKVLAATSKAKAKPQKKELVNVPSFIPMNERKWIDIEQGESFFSAFEILKEVINILRHSQTVQREDDGASSILEDEEFSSESISTYNKLVGCSLESMLVSSRRSEKEISVPL